MGRTIDEHLPSLIRSSLSNLSISNDDTPIITGDISVKSVRHAQMTCHTQEQLLSTNHNSAIAEANEYKPKKMANVQQRKSTDDRYACDASCRSYVSTCSLTYGDLIMCKHSFYRLLLLFSIL
jgi:hypothetical protein